MSVLAETLGEEVGAQKLVGLGWPCRTTTSTRDFFSLRRLGSLATSTDSLTCRVFTQGSGDTFQAVRDILGRLAQPIP